MSEPDKNENKPSNASAPEKKGWGGKRTGAGRKPKPPDAVSRSVDSETLRLRRDLDHCFKSGLAIKPPDDLGDIAYKKWIELMACYQDQGINIVNILDTTQLKLYVEAYERYELARQTWNEYMKLSNGMVATAGEASSRMINTAHKMMKDETAIMRSLAPDLGLTPTGRAKWGINTIEGQKKQEEDDKDFMEQWLASLNSTSEPVIEDEDDEEK